MREIIEEMKQHIESLDGWEMKSMRGHLSDQKAANVLRQYVIKLEELERKENK